MTEYEVIRHGLEDKYRLRVLRDLRRIALAVWIWAPMIWVAIVVNTCATQVAHAQPAHSTRDEAHAIAAVCASEIGLRPNRYHSRAVQAHRTDVELYENECAAIGWSLRTRATNLHRPLLWQVHAFASQVFNTDRSSRRWLAFLTPDARQPLHWATSVPWSRSAPAWARLRQVSQEVVEGTRANPCPGAEGWGGSMDRDRIRRMVARGWRVVTCGERGWTRNRFVRPPPRRREG